MIEYLDLLRKIRDNGVTRTDRTGVGTRSLFGEMMKFDLQNSFPLMTTKKLYWKAIAYELLWFLRGETNVKWLQNHGVTIWDEWADENGDLGPVYGHQWVNWVGADGKVINQITELEKGLKYNPMSRRHMVTAWNPTDVAKMALPPCHVLYQFYVNGNELSCAMYMRSTMSALAA